MNQEVMEHTEEAITPEASSSSVGEQLRAAREALGLGIDDVAAELRLHNKLIEALEENHRSELPPPAFVGGYIRSYARLLGLPAEQMVADYLKEGAVAETDYRPTDRSGERVVTSKDPKFRLITYTIVGLLLLLFGLWWANDRYSFVTPVQQAVEHDLTNNEQQETSLPLPPPSTTEEGVMPESEFAAAASATGATTADGEQANGAPEVVTQESPAEEQSQQQVAEEKPVEKPAPEVTNVPLPLSTPQATIRLDYQQASWTRVEDAKGRLLIYETVSAGRRVELHGVAPFKVFLGYAPGVKVYLNGALFSTAAYRRGELARFRAGSSRDNSPLDR